jgi:hypothetical protein
MLAADWVACVVERYADPQGGASLGRANSDSERDGATRASEVRPVLRP